LKISKRQNGFQKQQVIDFMSGSKKAKIGIYQDQDFGAYHFQFGNAINVVKKKLLGVCKN